MSLSPNWRLVFPYEDTRQVVALVQKTWDSLVARKIPHFNPDEHEPHLTQFLQSVLNVEKIDAGLTGDFSAEVHVGDADLATGRMKNRGRADIRYFSDRVNLDLTFEFKKLKPTNDSIQRYRGKDGMMRFVSGKYSRDQPLALMVGLICSDPDACISKLKSSIIMKEAVDELKLAELEPGKWLEDPTKELPPHVRFDSRHSRAHLNGRPDILLCHLFLLYGDIALLRSSQTA